MAVIFNFEKPKKIKGKKYRDLLSLRSFSQQQQSHNYARFTIIAMSMIMDIGRKYILAIDCRVGIGALVGVAVTR